MEFAPHLTPYIKPTQMDWRLKFTLETAEPLEVGKWSVGGVNEDGSHKLMCLNADSLETRTV